MRLFLIATILGALVALFIIGPTRPVDETAGASNRRRWPQQLGLIAAFSVLSLVLACSFQRKLLYHPSADGDFAPTGTAVPIEPVELLAEDGVKIHGWYLPPGGDADPRTRPAVVYFHGNAGNITHRRPLVVDLAANGRAHVLIIDYRGFGKSEGTPTEAGLYRDALAAYDWLAARDDVDPARMVVFGRSLGGGVATEVAVQRKPAGLVLESTFTSIADMARIVVGIPVGWLVVDRFDSIEKAPRIGCPVLHIHGDADEVIPYELGTRLHAAIKTPKRLVTVPRGHHNDTPAIAGESYRRVLFDFVDACARGEAAAALADGDPAGARQP